MFFKRLYSVELPKRKEASIRHFLTSLLVPCGFLFKNQDMVGTWIHQMKMCIYDLRRSLPSKNLHSTRMSTLARFWLEVEGDSGKHSRVHP